MDAIKTEFLKILFVHFICLVTQVKTQPGLCTIFYKSILCLDASRFRCKRVSPSVYVFICLFVRQFITYFFCLIKNKGKCTIMTLHNSSPSFFDSPPVFQSPSHYLSLYSFFNFYFLLLQDIGCIVVRSRAQNKHNHLSKPFSVLVLEIY